MANWHAVFFCFGRARVLVCLLLVFSELLFTPSFVYLKKIMTYISYKSLQSRGGGSLSPLAPLGHCSTRLPHSLHSFTALCSLPLLHSDPSLKLGHAPDHL